MLHLWALWDEDSLNSLAGNWVLGWWLDGVAEGSELLDEARRSVALGFAVEVVGSEILVGGAVSEHVVGRGQDGGGGPRRSPSSGRGGRAGAGTGRAGSWPFCGWPLR
jgi:hypothetical protein